jgi:comEA protein
MNASEKKALLLIACLWVTGLIADRYNNADVDLLIQKTINSQENPEMNAGDSNFVLEAQSDTINELGAVQEHKILDSAQTNSKKIGVNSANSQELQKIKGIGPKMAQAIIAYRQQHGAFQKEEDLLKVKGIGKKKLKNMLQFIKID